MIDGRSDTGTTPTCVDGPGRNMGDDLPLPLRSYRRKTSFAYKVPLRWLGIPTRLPPSPPSTGPVGRGDLPAPSVDVPRRRTH